MKRGMVIAAVAVVLVLLAQVAGYFVALKSDAYAEASRFVLSDTAIAKQLGRVQKVTLAPFDAEIRFTSETGTASFVLSTETDKGSRKVLVRLEKVNGTWKVTSSSVLT